MVVFLIKDPIRDFKTKLYRISLNVPSVKSDWFFNGYIMDTSKKSSTQFLIIGLELQNTECCSK